MLRKWIVSKIDFLKIREILKIELCTSTFASCRQIPWNSKLLRNKHTFEHNLYCHLSFIDLSCVPYQLHRVDIVHVGQKSKRKA